jgi:hypothetical protein
MESQGYNHVSVTNITRDQVVPILATYLFSVTEGNNIQENNGLAEATLVGYLGAAHTWLETKTRMTVPIHVTSMGGKTKLHELLGQTLDLRRAWRQPKEKREPFSFDMLATLHHMTSSATITDRRHVLGLQAATFDWIRLGIFTGSRVSEYAQTKSKRGSYLRVPMTAAAGTWAGSPIAFLASDFTILDDNSRVLSLAELLRTPANASHLHVRFRFDKSNQNFTIRKFRRSGHAFLCPILAAISILFRASALGVPDTAPLGAFRPRLGNPVFTYITSTDVIKIMRAACLATYPDPEHFLHKNVTRIVAHSLRVTAAVALFNMHYSIEEIAYRLRWQPQSVQHYLRECSKHSDERTMSAMMGACAI